MINKVIIKGSRQEFDDRVDRWYQSDIMVTLQSYLCLDDNQWHAFLNGNIIFSEDVENQKDDV